MNCFKRIFSGFTVGPKPFSNGLDEPQDSRNIMTTSSKPKTEPRIPQIAISSDLPFPSTLSELEATFSMPGSAAVGDEDQEVRDSSEDSDFADDSPHPFAGIETKLVWEAVALKREEGPLNARAKTDQEESPSKLGYSALRVLQVPGQAGQNSGRLLKRSSSSNALPDKEIEDPPNARVETKISEWSAPETVVPRRIALRSATQRA